MEYEFLCVNECKCLWNLTFMRTFITQGPCAITGHLLNNYRGRLCVPTNSFQYQKKTKIRNRVKTFKYYHY